MLIDSRETELPPVVQWLMENRLVRKENLLFTNDGFCIVYKSLSSILHSGGIDAIPDREDRILQCGYFFDDWFLFALPDRQGHVYGLIKMREQEHDQEKGIYADGDTPGVTISFIAFDSGVLKACLENPSASNRKQLGMEINRVVAYPEQHHHGAFKDYFIRPQAEAPYLIAELYTRQIASFCTDGVLNVPEAYKDIYTKRLSSKKYARIPDFLERNNRDANMPVCDHQKIYIRDAARLSEHEKLAILATHTGNVSVHSFAAEVRYHAMFLTDLAKIRLPLAGSPYASAIRADMSIADKEFQGPAPYYNLSGKLVRAQMNCHAEG